jgi:hypothetical protein
VFGVGGGWVWFHNKARRIGSRYISSAALSFESSTLYQRCCCRELLNSAMIDAVHCQEVVNPPIQALRSLRIHIAGTALSSNIV